MISKNTIDAVFETARVEEVIGDFVQLKKSGSNFKGLSPFTDERTPSFMVSPVKQIWKDFSSNKGGNVVSFLMEHEHFTYPEAIRYLAKKYGIEIEETEQTDEEKEKAGERESLYIVSEFAKDWFHKTLLETERGKAIGLTYFKERGFALETVKKFQLGYSPDEWEVLTTAALKEGYRLEYLQKTGLTIVKEAGTDGQQKQFDRFKGRVMFPIFSMSGRTLGFGGRILTNNKKAAKYLNSPESDIYHKSKVLYGLYHAKQAIAKEDNCYLVEGYTDVIQLHQTGVENVVSSSGTALTVEQVRLINRLTRNMTLLFDGDAAGLRAALRGVDIILEEGMNVRVCTFPEGEDPDSFSRRHSLDELTTYLQENAQDFINFKASLLAREADNDPIKKAETIRDMVTSIAKIPDPIKREIYVKQCAGIMDISEDVLFSTLGQIFSKERRDAAKKKPQEKPLSVVSDSRQPTEKVDVRNHLETKLLELLLRHGNETMVFEDMQLDKDENDEITYKPISVSAKVYEKLAADLHEDEVVFTNSLYQEVFDEVVEKFVQEESFDVNQYIRQLNKEKADAIIPIFVQSEKYELHDWAGRDIFVKSESESVPEALMQTLLRLRELLIVRKVAELTQEISSKSDTEKIEILKKIHEYNQLKKIVSNRLTTVVRMLS